MSAEPVFLTVSQVAALHRMSLEQHGGQDGLRDDAAFQSAMQQPLNTWFYAQGDTYDVAAAYAFHLAESQAFLDGNKRTGMEGLVNCRTVKFGQCRARPRVGPERSTQTERLRGLTRGEALHQSEKSAVAAY